MMKVVGIGGTKEYDRVKNWQSLVLLEEIIGGFVVLFPEPEAR